MPPASTFLGFLVAATLLALTPGPGIFYVLTRSLAGGRREGVLSSLGTFAGGFVHVIAAAFGLSVLLATSVLAYQCIRWMGAAYLVYLGIRMLKSASADMEQQEGEGCGNPFTQGVITEVLNPKTALFFLSFIPQFVDAKAGPVFPQFLCLGTISVCLNTAADITVASLAGPIGKWLRASRKARVYQRRTTGAMMIGLGAFVAAKDS